MPIIYQYLLEHKWMVSSCKDTVLWCMCCMNLMLRGIYLEKRVLPKYSTYLIVSKIRKFFFQNSIKWTHKVQTSQTITHYVRRIINSRLFRSVFLDFLQKFFSTWKLLPESNWSPRERSNHTKIIKIHREKPSQTLISLAKVINWDKKVKLIFWSNSRFDFIFI